MQLPHRVGQRRHAERTQVRGLDLGRQQLGQRRARQGISDSLAQIGLRDAGRARIDGREHLRQRRVLVDHAHRRMHDLEPEETAADVAANTQPLADRHLLDLRAVEVQEAQHQLAAVLVAQSHQQLAARAIGDLVVVDRALGLRELAGQQFAHRREGGLVLVAHRQVQNQVDRAREAELGELGRGLGGLLLARLRGFVVGAFGIALRRIRVGRIALGRLAPAAPGRFRLGRVGDLHRGFGEPPVGPAPRGVRARRCRALLASIVRAPRGFTADIGVGIDGNATAGRYGHRIGIRQGTSKYNGRFDVARSGGAREPSDPAIIAARAGHDAARARLRPPPHFLCSSFAISISICLPS